MKNVILLVCVFIIIVGAVCISLQITGIIHDKLHENHEPWIDIVYKLIADSNEVMKGKYFTFDVDSDRRVLWVICDPNETNKRLSVTLRQKGSD